MFKFGIFVHRPSSKIVQVGVLLPPSIDKKKQATKIKYFSYKISCFLLSPFCYSIIKHKRFLDRGYFSFNLNTRANGTVYEKSVKY